MTFYTMLPQLGAGMLKSMGIFFWTVVLSLPLGLFVSFGRMSKNSVIRNIIKIYISVMRGTPLMLQLMIVYYSPFLLFGMNIRTFRFPAIIIGFTINYAAYFAEIFRSGIESMPVGQYEAAQLLGYSKSQTFMKIILPQVIKRILPAVTNEVITLVKDTSLAFSLAYMEMFTIAKQIVAKDSTFVPFIVAEILYYVFNFVVAAVMENLEKRMSYYK